MYRLFTQSFKKIYFAALLVITALHVSGQDELAGLTSNGGADGGGTAFTIKTNGTAFSVFKNFSNNGANAQGQLTAGPDGALYGVASEGGTYNHGTIFKVNTTGVVTVLKHLNLSADGGYPKGSLTLGRDGNLYGVLSAGSINNGGAIFRITTSGVFTIIRSLSVNTDGGRPSGKLIQATDGNFYGINYAGGTYGYGTIFRITPTGTYTVLKALNYTSEGGNSYGSLVQARDGHLYGMTYWGGSFGYGTIFKITTAGAFTILKHLNGPVDGGYPRGDLIQGTDGALYGMAGVGPNYNGTVFKITTAGVFTRLRSLSAGVEGANPSGSLIQAPDGNFYGLTSAINGGFTGSVFKMTPAGATTVLKKFTLATDGGYPAGTLMRHSDGFLYGLTTQGGQNFYGTVFKISTAGAFTVISHLNGANHGNVPQDMLAVGRDSTYYGVASSGGAFNFGTIYKICGSTTTVLKSLNKNVEGGNPAGGLLRATDGNYYGTAQSGGANGGGTIFKITPTGVFTVLRHLKSATDGGNPPGMLTQGTDGLLYGMNSAGGTNGAGTIFKISTTGTYTVLRHLVYASDGSNPQGGLVLAKDGAFYGITSSNSKFFKITSAGVFTVLASLNSGTHGTGFEGRLVQHTDNNFYGNMFSGGSSGYGTIIKITPAGVITVLRHLTMNDGTGPKGALAVGSDGNFYGLASGGGTNKNGTIFRITPAGVFTVLKHLNIRTDGAAPNGGLVLAPKRGIAATPQSNIPVTEDNTKAVVLSGTGGTNFVYTIVVPPKNGTVTGTGANRSYKPNLNYVGRDSFAFTVGIGCMASAPAYVSFVVSGVNDAPVLAPIGNKTVKRGSQLSFTATATDPDAGQTRSFSLITPPSGAVINASTGIFTWTPNVTGTFTFKVRVTDNGSPVLFDEESITVTVTATLTASAATEEETAPKGIRHTEEEGVYPNPVERITTVVLEEPFQKVSSKVVDMKGATLMMNRHQLAGANRISFDLSSLVAGEYLIRVATEKNAKTFKVIKK